MKSGRSPLLILILAITFLFLRNVPLCFIMPLWSAGDEIGHFDYVLKLNRGHFPEHTEYIESSLFLLHRAYWDNRYFTEEKAHQIREPEDLGLAAYSYQANQPPLPHMIMALFRKVFLLLNFPMLLQIKLLRITSLLAVACGLLFIYSGLRKTNVQNHLFYYPLLFIPLLAQDLFFSINNDVFAFLGASFAIMRMIYVFKNPHLLKNWAWLSVGVSLAMWMKVTNAFLFVLWFILTIFLWQRKKGKKIIVVSILFLLLALLFSSPWYIYNQVRFSSPFGLQFVENSDIPFPKFSPVPVTFNNFRMFVYAFSRTLFRGELFWNGRYFDVILGLTNNLVLTYLPLVIFLAGFVSFFIYYDRSNREISRFFLLSGLVIFSALLFIYFFIGKIGAYHARYAFGGIYFIMFFYAAGWRKLLNSDKLALYVPSVVLLAYNLLYLFVLIPKVL